MKRVSESLILLSGCVLFVITGLGVVTFVCLCWDGIINKNAQNKQYIDKSIWRVMADSIAA